MHCLNPCPLSHEPSHPSRAHLYTDADSLHKDVLSISTPDYYIYKHTLNYSSVIKMH